MNRENWKKYEDIISLPHHVSKKRAPMPLQDRAAQFSPFAALTGHGAAVKETERLTDQQIELEEYEKQQINQKLQWISQHLSDKVQVELTYFVPDLHKTGGSYERVKGYVKKFEEWSGNLLMEDGKRIPVEDIIDVSADVFE